MNILILLADDHKIMRDCLRVLIEQEQGMDVIGESSTGRQTLTMAKRLRPDVVVLDVGFADLSGIEVAREVHQEYPEMNILALSMHSDPHYVREMFRAGASGYILKGSAFEDLCKGIRAVHDGRRYIGSGLQADVTVETGRKAVAPENMAGLTERELDVLRLLARGRTTKKAAEELGLSPKTVGTHRTNIMQKLELHSIAELTKYAVRQGIVPLQQ